MYSDKKEDVDCSWVSHQMCELPLLDGARTVLELSEHREGGKHEEDGLNTDESEWEQLPLSRALRLYETTGYLRSLTTPLRDQHSLGAKPLRRRHAYRTKRKAKER